MIKKVLCFLFGHYSKFDHYDYYFCDRCNRPYKTRQQKKEEAAVLREHSDKVNKI